MEARAGSVAGVSRLTGKEKECLRRRLLPQTAKEMAIDLGISPHAVEKRLKMARLKLDVPTSLAAARLLAAAEGYGSPVPRSSDLSGHIGREEAPRVTAGPVREPSRLPKGALMILLSVLAFTTQDVAPRDKAAPPPLTDERHLPVSTRRVGFDEAVAFEQQAFKDCDRDGSGYLDPTEASNLEPRDGSRDPTLPTAPASGQPDPAGATKWMAKLDTNRDGRVSEQEYVGYMLPWTLWQGVPASWHPARPPNPQK